MADLKELYLKCESKWGRPAQIMMLIEEMAELTKAMAKTYRCYNEKTELDMIQEMADVEIMIEQITTIFHIGERVREQKKIKLNRLTKLVSID